MARPPKEDRGSVKNVLVAFRVSPNVQALLSRLIEARAEEVARLTGQPLGVTVGSYLSWLILRDAEARGISSDGHPATVAADVAEQTKRNVETVEKTLRGSASGKKTSTVVKAAKVTKPGKARRRQKGEPP
jgi:hypothetical protein